VIVNFLHSALAYDDRKIFSTGTALDTARLKSVLARRLSVSPADVDGVVMGEHGDSSMIPFTRLRIGCEDFSKFGEDEDAVTSEVRTRGMDIIDGKGSTEFGIASVVNDVARAVLANERKTMPVSAFLDGEYGQSGFFAGVPAIIGSGGVERVVEYEMSEEEFRRFDASCRVIREFNKRASEL
jgi:L-lactate dehydrogenase